MIAGLISNLSFHKFLFVNLFSFESSFRIAIIHFICKIFYFKFLPTFDWIHSRFSTIPKFLKSSSFRSRFVRIYMYAVYEIFNWIRTKILQSLKLKDWWIHLKFELSRTFICIFFYLNRVFESQLYISYKVFCFIHAFQWLRNSFLKVRAFAWGLFEFIHLRNFLNFQLNSHIPLNSAISILQLKLNDSFQIWAFTNFYL